VLTKLLEMCLPDVLTVIVFVAVSLLERPSEIVRLLHVTAPLEFDVFYDRVLVTLLPIGSGYFRGKPFPV
jgi:hypothetical protein